MRSTILLGACGVLVLAGLAAAGCTDDAYCYTCGRYLDAEPDAAEEADASDASDEPEVAPPDASEEEAAAPSCPAGYTDCNQASYDGCEVKTSEDKKNCGTCGNACSIPNADSECKAGVCVLTVCVLGFENCDGDVANGCEAKLSEDPQNCGACATPCDTAANAMPVCELGKCKSFACIKDLNNPDPSLRKDYENCNGDPSDGCEVELLGDIQNCGICGRVCDATPQATAGCSAGSCGVGACQPGYEDCDGSVWSGCEAQLTSDFNNCGACGSKCPDVANGTGACAASTCVVLSNGCYPGYADCDKALATGCESQLSTDVTNCGACGKECLPPDHATPACSHFQCGIKACETGWGDCSGGVTDGCETDLTTDLNHCGTCSTVCPDGLFHAQRGCSNSACVIASCDKNYEDCNGQVLDGCETALLSDVNNCGTCGHGCPAYVNAVSGCTFGFCGIAACEPGFSNCDGDIQNGCEKDTSTDPQNCGGCGVVCGTEASGCASSRCVCNMSALLILDDSASGADPLKLALEAAGFFVKTSGVPSYQYDGTNLAPTGFGVVLLLAGGPLPASYQTDMPDAGQTALVQFVAKSNGLVLTEWAAQHVANGRWQILKPLVLLDRTVAFSGQVQYTVEPAFASHPIWEGLPSSFTFASTSNVGLANLGAGIKRVASSPQALDAVAIRDLPGQGRVAHLAHAGNYAPNGWSNTNVQTLVVNAAKWTARCQ